MNIQLKNDVYKLYCDGLNDIQISENLHICKSTIQRYRHDILKLPKHSNNKVELVLKLVAENKSDLEIAQLLNITAAYVKQIRLSHHILIKPKCVPNNYQYNRIEKQVIIGSLLGDGCLIHPHENGGTSLVIKHCMQQYDYLKYKFSFLKNNSNSIKVYDRIDYRFRNPYYQACILTTKSSISLNVYYYNWYKPTKHISLYDIYQLEPLGLAIWYMDDGSKSKDGGCILSTNCFECDEVYQLQKMLFDRFNVNSHVYEISHRIYIPKKEFFTFKDIVDKYIIDSMKYKVRL